MLTRYAHRNLVWIDCVSPTPPEVRSLMHEFSLDPLIAEELLLPSYKPRVEKRGETIYCILHFPTLRGGQQHPEQEIDFVLGKHFLITTRYETVDPLHSFSRAFEANTVLQHDNGMSHGGHLFVAMVRSIYQGLADECYVLERHLREIEERVFSGDERRMVAELSQVGRTIHDFRRSLAPHREMLSSLEAVAGRLFGAEFSYHLRAVASAQQRVDHTLENLRDSLSELRETNNSLLSTKQNEIMKNLTALAFIFLPLTFIGQILGMNMPMPLETAPNAFWLVLGAMGFLALVIFVYFKRRGWL